MPRGAGLRGATGALADCVRVGHLKTLLTSHHFENTADGALFVDPYGPMLMTTA